jgi:hypothetical protein
VRVDGLTDANDDDDDDVTRMQVVLLVLQDAGGETRDSGAEE